MPRDTRRGGWLPFLVAAAALAAADREPTPVPPYGAADFVPTPATPIGFRADGNGSFPGATPPIDWYEGTPTIVQVAVNRGHNRKPSPHWDLADRTSKNILWKAPLPGSSLSNPIVVGDRVICQHAPHGVTCHDARTGELLWRDELGVMHLPVLDEHRGLGPAPDAARAKAEQTAWELTRAGYLLVARFKGLLDRRAKGGDARWAKRRPDFERALARARQWRGMLDPSLPQGVTAAFDRLVATFEKVLAASDHQARVKAFYKPGQRLCGEVGKMLGAPTFFVWQGDVVSSFSTPVSDGTLVAVCFPWGQVAAYRVTTGERVWAWRDPLVPGSRWMNHGPSPFMLDDLLLVRSGDGQAWMGLDKATGRVRWETAVQSQPRGRGANHGNYVTPVLMDLPTAAGGMRKALVTQDPPVLDPYTGKSFGDLLYRGKPRVRTGHGIMVGRDGHLIMGWSADNFSTPNFGFNLSVDGEHLAVAMANNLAPGRGKVHFGARPIVYQPGRLVGDAGKLFDPASGARLSGGGRDSVIGRSRLASATLCGAVMVGAIDTGGGGRHRSDGKATAMFGCLDVREPLHPRVLSLGNCLDGDQLPADPIFDTYLEGFDKRPSLGCYRGLAAWFGCRLGGVAPQGDRLYIQTNFGLYCIGPEALGGPKDEAATLAAIAAATAPEALADHLDDESPNHRRSALRRLVELREPLRPT